MAYKIGNCAQCGKQIMVRGADGRWSSFKPDFDTMYLEASNGIKIKTNVCKQCKANPDLEKIMSELFDKSSKAFDSSAKKILQNNGFDKDAQVNVFERE